MSADHYGDELIGKRAVVTGAARGIGAACAKALAHYGLWVACADLEMPEDTVTEIKSSQGNAIGVACDVSQEDDVLNLFECVRSQVGRLDFLVHCAGVIHERPLLETDISEFDHVMNVNLRGTFLVGREAIRTIYPNKGRVVLISSDLGYSGRETFSPYVASKHGVVGLVRSWAKEFSPNILVNAICPGPIDTAMLGSDNMTEEWRQKEMDIPLSRFGLPEEVAEMAVFLASDSARFITGQGMHVNGGSVMP